jgi:hypothetical protein
MPRIAGYPGRPADHVDGPFTTGIVRADAPAGVSELAAAARALEGHLEATGTSVSGFAELAGVDRATVADFLAGRVFIDTFTLARLERAAGRRLWGLDSP